MGNQNSVPATNCAPQPKQQSDDAMLHNNHPAPKKDQEKIKAEVWAYALSEDVNKSNKRKDPPISSSRNLDTSSIYLNPHIKKGVRKKCRTTNNSLFHLGLQKKLLQAIEDCGGLKRNDKAWLRTLCEANCDIYGPSKSKLRASVYNKVFKWKQLSREEYLELLDECGVTPGKPAGDTQKQEPRRVLPIGPTPPPDDDVPQSATIAAAAKPTHLVPAHLQQLAHSTFESEIDFGMIQGNQHGIIPFRGENVQVGGLVLNKVTIVKCLEYPPDWKKCRAELLEDGTGMKLTVPSIPGYMIDNVDQVSMGFYCAETAKHHLTEAVRLSGADTHLQTNEIVLRFPKGTTCNKTQFNVGTTKGELRMKRKVMKIAHDDNGTLNQEDLEFIVSFVYWELVIDGSERFVPISATAAAAIRQEDMELVMDRSEHPTCATAGAAIKQEEDTCESKPGLSHPSKEDYVPLCLSTKM